MALAKNFGVAVIGCGTVGNATAALLLKNADFFQIGTDRKLVLKALVDKNFERAKKAGLKASLFNEDLADILANDAIHLVVETVGGLTVARTIIEKALKAGKHVVTANKALLAHYGAELFALARENGVSIGFEASCAGGIPIVRTLVEGLAANSIEALYGIVNGTSNYILTEMVDGGRSYVDALQGAQAEGLAEADSSLDVNGMDAAHKITILASLAFGERVFLEKIPVEGIDGIHLVDVAAGKDLGYVLKLIAIARQTEEGLEVAVKPMFLHNTHPLSRVSGPFNAVSVYGDSVGHTMYYGRGAGGNPTASAVVSDILSIAIGTWPTLFNQLPIWMDQCAPAIMAGSEAMIYRYYLRFNIQDESGVVAKITAEFAQRGVSLNAFVQKESQEGQWVPVVMTTHAAREDAVFAAFKVISALSTVSKDAVCIRIIDEHVEKL